MEGIEMSVIHKKERGEYPVAVCGYSLFWKGGKCSGLWKRVDCKNCLKRKK